MGEAVQRGFEGRGGDVEVVAGLIHARESVRGARVLSEELGVVVLARVLFGDETKGQFERSRCTTTELQLTFSVPMNIKCSQK